MTKESEAYTFRSNSTFSYRKSSVLSFPTMYSNTITEKRGAWLLHEGDTSFALTVQQERTPRSDSSIRAGYGNVNSSNGSSEWDDCSYSCTEVVTAKSLREDGFRRGE
jgi:hypothetical protein